MTPHDRIRLIGPLSGDRRIARRRVECSAFILYSGALVAAALVPQAASGAPPFPGWDKVVHGAVFFAHVLLAWRVLPRSLPVAAASSLAFGVVLELAQLGVATRTASLGDVAADAFGVVAGIVAIVLWERRTLAGRCARRILGRHAQPADRKEGESCSSGASRSSDRAS